MILKIKIGARDRRGLYVHRKFVRDIPRRTSAKYLLDGFSTPYLARSIIDVIYVPHCNTKLDLLNIDNCGECLLLRCHKSKILEHTRLSNFSISPSACNDIFTKCALSQRAKTSPICLRNLQSQALLLTCKPLPHPPPYHPDHHA